jgi:hypothetical protein
MSKVEIASNLPPNSVADSSSTQVVHAMVSIQSALTDILLQVRQLPLSLEATQQELAGQTLAAARSIQQQDQAALNPLRDALCRHSQALRRTAQDLALERQALSAMARALSIEHQQIATASQRLVQSLSQTLQAIQAAARGRWAWVLPLACLVVVLSATLVIVVGTLLPRVLPPSKELQEAAWARLVWSRATPSERAQLQSIARRPAVPASK